MGNVYRDQRDDVAQGMVDSAISRLKNPGGVKPLGFRDKAKTALDYQPVPPPKIGKTSEWPKKIPLVLPW